MRASFLPSIYLSFNLPGDGWRDGTWLGCVRPCLRLSRAALWSLLRGEGEAEGRVYFSAPVRSPSKKAWVVTGIGAGWLRELARGEREAREAGAVAAAKAEAVAAAPKRGR
jgi:hypothetical protein